MEQLEIKVTRESCLQAIEAACESPMKGGHVRLGSQTAMAIAEFLRMDGAGEVTINTSQVPKYRPKYSSNERRTVVSKATGGKKK